MLNILFITYNFNHKAFSKKKNGRFLSKNTRKIAHREGIYRYILYNILNIDGKRFAAVHLDQY